MSSTFNISLNINVNKMSSIEINILYIITITGIYLLIIAIYKMKSSCFLFHHCIICLILSVLCLPYLLSFSNYSIRCDYLGNIQVTCVTAQLLNMAAMVANEAYTFEDLIHQDLSLNNSHSHSHSHSQQNSHSYYQYQLKQSNKSTISCGCLSFGILIIWFSSVILHLGITMIGSESKSYYDNDGQYCNFIIRDIRGYVLTLMWIIITIFSLMITIRYIHKILSEVSLKRRNNQPLLSLAILGQYHGQTIATKDILMQQIQLRIKLNILLIVLFIIFWFPLFIVTLCDIKFKISEQILRYLLLLAWSNSSISPLTYCLLLPKCNYLCRLCCQKDRSTTYDSLTSYYNRIGDRFHDIGKWDQYDQDNQQINKLNKTSQINSHNLDNDIHLETDFDVDHEHLNEHKFRKKLTFENQYKLNEFRPNHSNLYNTKSSSLIVKEISNNKDDNSSSSLSSLTTITNKQDHLSNGLIVTSIKNVHL
ncbi:unnamed protein product [Rotaria socialis]|uniref:G-protein coupled receptors family 1 profile domain-containing protein n=2 Tax=Rotaria socialis TaxID=392032 RepID=A0A817T7U9_9BILA|nr:unnamed protein product [Rotaria socialis]CAF4477162.1 unnamed protein product [Rotaria socialis]